VTATAICLGGCDWTATGDKADVDKQAAAHTAKVGHATATVVKP
jgi:hypothetical protein